MGSMPILTGLASLCLSVSVFGAGPATPGKGLREPPPLRPQSPERSQLQVNEAMARLEANNPSLNLARVRLKAAQSAQRRFAAGELASLAVIDALAALHNAEMRHESARASRQAGAVEIQRLVGAWTR